MPVDRTPGTRRIWLPAILLGIFALVAIARLVQIQVVEHGHYSTVADKELIDKTTVYARRGAIVDRNGNVLAISVDTWDIYVNASVWQDASKAGPASEALGKLISMDPAAIRTSVTSATQKDPDIVQVLVKRDVPYAIGTAIIHEDLDGVVPVADHERDHPEGDLAASLLGLTGIDNSGLAGIEYQYNAILQGTPGKSIFERDTVGDPIPFGQSVAVPPKPGQDLVLTIDRNIQQMAEQRLHDAIVEHRAKGGQLIVADPNTGQILALASEPGLKYSTLDFNDPATTRLLQNSAVSNLYEPGSEFKLVTASAAIDAGAVTPNTTYYDPGYVDIGGTIIHNWEDEALGEQTMLGVLQNSLNSGAVFMAQQLGEEKFYNYVKAFGFGQPTGIDLPGEAVGHYRTPSDPGFSPVDFATQSFGQSITVTPLQMIQAVSAIVNGGKLIAPHIVKATIDANGVEHSVEPKVAGNPISPETSATMRMMMHYDLESPGYRSEGDPKYYLAGGKSSTANVPVSNGGYNDLTQIASFVEFAPLNDPKVLVLVTLDENQDLETGSIAAGPVAAKLIDDVLRYMNVAPDRADYPPYDQG
jgi:cell division protein FtsI/penicillin-binding protein 2